MCRLEEQPAHVAQRKAVRAARNDQAEQWCERCFLHINFTVVTLELSFKVIGQVFFYVIWLKNIVI